MKNSEKGIALITTLILGLIALAFIGALLYLLLSGTKVSGISKRYTTAIEAAKGGAQLVISKILSGENLTCNGGDPCVPCPDTESRTCKIDINPNKLGDYNIEAYLLNELDFSTYKIFAIKIKSYNSTNPSEKAEIEFVYKVK